MRPEMLLYEECITHKVTHQVGSRKVPMLQTPRDPSLSPNQNSETPKWRQFAVYKERLFLVGGSEEGHRLSQSHVHCSTGASMSRGRGKKYHWIKSSETIAWPKGRLSFNAILLMSLSEEYGEAEGSELELFVSLTWLRNAADTLGEEYSIMMGVKIDKLFGGPARRCIWIRKRKMYDVNGSGSGKSNVNVYIHTTPLLAHSL